MDSKDRIISRRRSLALGAALATGTIAGCSEDSTPAGEDGNQSEEQDLSTDSQDNLTDGSDPDGDEDSTGESEETDSLDDEQSEDSGEEQLADLVTTENTYVASYENDGFREMGEYAPRSTVSTIDAFIVEFSGPEIAESVTLDSEGVSLSYDGESIGGENARILEQSSATELTVGLLVGEFAAPGEHTISLEFTDAVADLPDDRRSATESVEFSVAEPTGSVDRGVPGEKWCRDYYPDKSHTRSERQHAIVDEIGRGSSNFCHK